MHIPEVVTLYLVHPIGDKPEKFYDLYQAAAKARHARDYGYNVRMTVMWMIEVSRRYEIRVTMADLVENVKESQKMKARMNG